MRKQWESEVGRTSPLGTPRILVGFTPYKPLDAVGRLAASDAHVRRHVTAEKGNAAAVAVGACRYRECNVISQDTVEDLFTEVVRVGRIVKYAESLSH